MVSNVRFRAVLVSAGVAFASLASAKAASVSYTPPPSDPQQAALFKVSQALGLDGYVTDASYIANGSVAKTDPVPTVTPTFPGSEVCSKMVVPPQINIPLENVSYGAGQPVSYDSSLRYIGATILLNYCLIGGLIPDLLTFIPGGEIDAQQVGTLTWIAPKLKNAVVQRRAIDSQFTFGVNFIGFSALANPLWLIDPSYVLGIPFALNGSLSTKVKTTLGAANKPFSDAQLSFAVDDARFTNGTTLNTLLAALQAKDVVAILKRIQVSAHYSVGLTLANGTGSTVAGRIYLAADDTNATLDLGLDNGTTTLHLVVPLASLQGLGYGKQVPGLVSP